MVQPPFQFHFFNIIIIFDPSVKKYFGTFKFQNWLLIIHALDECYVVKNIEDISVKALFNFEDI